MMNITYTEVYNLTYGSMSKQAAVPGPVRQRIAAALRSGAGRAWQGTKALPGKYWGAMKKAPYTTALTTVGLGATGADLAWSGIDRLRANAAENDPTPVQQMTDTIKNPSSAPQQQKNNLATAGIAGLVGAAGIYGATGLVPGLKKRKLLRALAATAGGLGAGYLGWNAANNYQNSSQN